MGACSQRSHLIIFSGGYCTTENRTILEIQFLQLKTFYWYSSDTSFYCFQASRTNGSFLVFNQKLTFQNKVREKFFRLFLLLGLSILTSSHFQEERWAESGLQLNPFQCCFTEVTITIKQLFFLFFFFLFLPDSRVIILN